jgi:hypothetical protein
MNHSLPLTVTVLLLAVCGVSAATLYVSLESTNPTPPYATWDTAATNIQDAVNVAGDGDTLVVTDGVYPGGVTVTNPLTLLSVNGPQFTVINGDGTNQCVSLTDGASLSGFTLTNGGAYQGGGVWCTSTNAVLTNCVIAGNSAESGGGALGGTLRNCALSGNSAGGYGGGAYGGTLDNCTLSGNSATNAGGGAYGGALYNCALTGNWTSSGGGACLSTLYDCRLSGNAASIGGGGAGSCTLYNCRLTDNSAPWGGGVSDECELYNCTVVDNVASDSGGGVAGSTLFNSIVAYNAAWADDNYTSDSTLNYCCTVPLPTNGFGNIAVPPEFVDYANGNLRLQSDSPCINAGNNAYVTTTTDLDGNPRIVSGTVDIGAYEYQGAGSVISYAWLQQYGLPTDGSADFADPDHDGMNNWQEWVCGTNPTNALSVLRMVSALPTSTNATVTWESVAGVNYFMERSANLGSPFALLATNIVGQAGTTSYADTNATSAGPFFYRVGVRAP